MDRVCPPNNISLEILVHTSARVTNAEDEVYRAQGRALLAYLDRRHNQPITVEQISFEELQVGRTSSTEEVLVPATNACPTAKDPAEVRSTLAIAESILTSGRSTSVSSGKESFEATSTNQLVHLAQNYRSVTTSTASNSQDTRACHRSAPVQSSSSNTSTKQRNRRKRTRQTCPQTPQLSVSPGAIISPDSAKFAFLSPNRYRIKKRALEGHIEEPRRAGSIHVLCERSPNKRLKRIAIESSSSRTSITTKQQATEGLHPEGWLASLAQLTSSSASHELSQPEKARHSSTPEQDKIFQSLWPDTGDQIYTTHVVGSLALIAGNPKLCAAYKPKLIARSIGPLERGYWHLKIPFSWSSKDQEDFWTLLEDMITEARCGWGLWVEYLHEPVIMSDRTVGDAICGIHCGPGYVAELKVWCWGEVAREVFLALLMASRRKTIRSGMIWYDSCGSAVIQMR